MDEERVVVSKPFGVGWRTVFALVVLIFGIGAAGWMLSNKSVIPLVGFTKSQPCQVDILSETGKKSSSMTPTN